MEQLYDKYYIPESAYGSTQEIPCYPLVRHFGANNKKVPDSCLEFENLKHIGDEDHIVSIFIGNNLNFSVMFSIKNHRII